MTVQLMPVTTRAASLRAQTTEGTTLLANSTALTQVLMPILTGKTIRKCRSQSKQLKVQPSITSIEPEICSTVEQKSSVLQV
ncbi:unnamed protein product [Rotaria sordida]|uniref:Uncharacterized protein n=1 Tax=Rotaria sordida TaxID=392033 RepID=A0A813NQT2_9BILA|nr:unnamed protein product [Rotaria sordida]CAF0801781.1 unnamed protein product [Rotaria sordida]